MSEKGITTMDAFEEMGTKRGLVLEIGDLRAVFRARSKSEHPDGGGESGKFSDLQEAFTILSHPSKRLRHWLELIGAEGGLRGPISSGMVDIFAQISQILQEADHLIREREAAATPLAKALLEGRVQVLREGLEAAQETLLGEVDGKVAQFERIEAGEADGWEVARDLAFLEKWQGQVKERYAALW